MYLLLGNKIICAQVVKGLRNRRLMKTITTDEERMQLHKNGYFLEGYFNSLRSMNVGKMALLFSVFVFTFVLLFVYYLELWKMLTVVALISVAGCVVFEPLLNIMDLRWFQKRKVKQFGADLSSFLRTIKNRLRHTRRA